MKNLVLLTNIFPYGNAEPYLETEVKYYNDFDNIYICALQVHKKDLKSKRKLPNNKFHVCTVEFAPKYIYILNGLSVLVDKNFYCELKKLITQRRLNVKRLVRLTIYLSRAHYEAGIIIRYFKKHGLLAKTDDDGVIYSYRFEYQPYVGILLKKYLENYKFIARAHRYDLYEERNNDKYIPLRECLLEQLDKVVLIAEDGLRYLKNKFPQYGYKMLISRLGTADYGITEEVDRGETFNIVSCSNIVPVKRLDLLMSALSLIDNVDIVWTHYGDGILMKDLRRKCKDLPKNVQVNLMGNVDNAELMKRYKTENYHVFINVSESEGLPVSIMEAMSFGIPVIATNAGGTGEIVQDRYNGSLLPVDLKASRLATCIKSMATIDKDEYLMLRRNSRKTWETRFNADRNYKDFTQYLFELTEK